MSEKLIDNGMTRERMAEIAMLIHAKITIGDDIEGVGVDRGMEQCVIKVLQLFQSSEQGNVSIGAKELAEELCGLYCEANGIDPAAQRAEPKAMAAWDAVARWLAAACQADSVDEAVAFAETVLNKARRGMAAS